MLRVKVANPDQTAAIDREVMRNIAKAVLKGEGITNASLSLAFVDDATIHRINKQFLNHDEPTDVVTFPLSNPGAKILEGELVIGTEVANRVAKERCHDLQSELALYVIHGVLHLCGYDDKTPSAATAMRKRERHYLSLAGLPDIAES